MEAEELEKATEIVKNTSTILNCLPSSKRERIDDIEVVFVDVLNGRFKVKRACTFMEVLKAITDGGKPIGVITIGWIGVGEGVESIGFPDITAKEDGLLLHALAKAQDCYKEMEE